MTTWVDLPPASLFPLENLPYAATPDGVVVAIGDDALLLAPAAATSGSAYAGVLARPSLDGVLALGPAGWRELRALVTAWLSDASMEPAVRPHLRRRDQLELLLPFTVADYVDFYASEHHATNLGRLLRPGTPQLLPNWSTCRSATTAAAAPSSSPAPACGGRAGSGGVTTTRRSSGRHNGSTSKPSSASSSVCRRGSAHR